MKVAFGSVIYPVAIKYLQDFFESLKKQTVQDFDIVLINDNVSQKIIMKELEKYFKIFRQRLIIINPDKDGLKPYQLRIELLRQVKKRGYQLLILGDCDDCCSNERIEYILNQYMEKATFFYNELRSFADESIMPKLPQRTDSIEQIMEQNYLGLTNTAISMDKLSVEFVNSLEDGKTNIFDWYLFSRILLSGGYGKKIENTCTYYRIYSDNLAGVCTQSVNDLEKERKIKIQHYQILKKYDMRYERLIEKYKNLEIQPGDNKEKVFWWGGLQ